MNNSFQTGNITGDNVTIINFQGVPYNIENQKDIDQFLSALQPHKTLLSAMEKYFGKQFEELKEGQKEMLAQLARMTDGKYGNSVELENQLRELEKEKQALIKKLKEYEGDSDFKKLSEQAAQALSNGEFERYHQIFSNFCKEEEAIIERQEARLEARKQNVARASYLQAEEYRGRVLYREALELYQKAVKYHPKEAEYLHELGFQYGFLESIQKP